MSSLSAFAPTNGAVACTYRTLLNKNQISISRNVCFGYKLFLYKLTHVHRALFCVRMCIYVTVCVCVHVCFLNTHGEVGHSFNACKMGLWEAPSFIAEMTENLEWEEDLRVWKCIMNMEIVRVYFFHSPLSPDHLRYDMLTFPSLSCTPIGSHVLLQFLLHLGKPLSQTKPLNSELLPTYTFCACNICCDVASRKLTMLCFKLLEHEASV